jgi:SH3-like domain-containing protein
MVIFKKKLSITLFTFMCTLLSLWAYQSHAKDKDSLVKQHRNHQIQLGRITHLPIPRFVSLKGDKTNMRSGPGKDYALLWVYQKKGLPVEIIDEYDQWRRVRDLDGSEGWIHQSVLSGRRMVVTLEGTHYVYDSPDSSGDIVAKIDGGTLASPEKCIDYYCLISHSEFTGWIKKNVLYGIDDAEKLTF